MVIMEALKPVFINGRIIESGSKFSCSLDFSKKLLEAESAKIASKTDSPDAESRVKELEALTKDELLKLAQEKGIEGLTDRNKKDDIIKALLAG